MTAADAHLAEPAARRLLRACRSACRRCSSSPRSGRPARAGRPGCAASPRRSCARCRCCAADAAAAGRVRGPRTALYPWSRPGAFAHAPAIAGKARYLTHAVRLRAHRDRVRRSGCCSRGAFRRASLAQDRARRREPAACTSASTGWARCFIVVFALTITAGRLRLARRRWTPSWSSTMFAVYVFAGAFVQGIAAITLATVALMRRAAACAAVVGEQQLHDLGKMLFAFSIFWAYIWVCQYLLIWYGNIPEEVDPLRHAHERRLAAAVRRQRPGQLGGPVPRPAVGAREAATRAAWPLIAAIVLRRALARPLRADHAGAVARAALRPARDRCSPPATRRAAGAALPLPRRSARRWSRSTIPCWPPTRPPPTPSSGGTRHDPRESHQRHERRSRSGRPSPSRSRRVAVVAWHQDARDGHPEPHPGGRALPHQRGAGLPAALRGVLGRRRTTPASAPAATGRSSTSGTAR